MQTLPSYTNAKGETFTISFEESQLPAAADYWGFYYIVADSKQRKRAFRLVIKKSFLADHKQAEAYSVQHPLQRLHGLLEIVEDGRSPLFLPDTTKGWEVF